MAERDAGMATVHAVLLLSAVSLEKVSVSLRAADDCAAEAAGPAATVHGGPAASYVSLAIGDAATAEASVSSAASCV